MRQIKLSEVYVMYQAKQLSRQLATRKTKPKVTQYQSTHVLQSARFIKRTSCKTNQI